MESLKSNNAFNAIRHERIIATVVIDDIEAALPLAETLLSSGIRCVELTLRTDAAIEAMRKIVAAFPELLVGTGTVLNIEQFSISLLFDFVGDIVVQGFSAYSAWTR